MNSPRIIQTPKAYYKTRRLDGHSLWQLAFWRELFQNSVDAGAKRIDIEIENAVGRGSFGRDANLDEVVRIKFSDDGRGMTQDVLENVFFKPGETTKKDNSTTGGFGTARLMLCFSQVRYAIRTNEWVVEGDGGEFTCMTRDEALQVRKQEMDAVVGQAQYAPLSRSYLDLEATSNIKGCQFEIDVDPNEHKAYYKATRSFMEEQLEAYLSMSQLPCKVFLSGEEMTQKSVKGPVKRVLVAEMNGQEIEFATAHVSSAEKAKFKGKILVRSNGALMYESNNYGMNDAQIIIEIDPNKARSVLTENRDGIRDPYRDLVERFKRDLIIDSKSALKEESNRRHTLIRGGLGSMRVSRRLSRQTEQKEENYSSPGEMSFSIQSKEFNPVRLGPNVLRQLNDDEVLQCLLDVYKKRSEGYPTFLDEYQNQFHVTACQEMLVERDRYAETRQYQEFMDFALSRIRASGGEPVPEINPIDGMHDIHIQTNDPAEKVRKILFKYYPHNWRAAGDKPAQGVYAHCLLAAWNVAVEHAANVMLTVLPSEGLSLPLKVATGFYFSKNESMRINGNYVEYRTGAVHSRLGKLHLLLINPVNMDGTATFDLGQDVTESSDISYGSEARPKQGLQKIAALAMHEVAHVVKRQHDEEYASVLTEIMGSARCDLTIQEMRRAIDDTKQMYIKPKSSASIARTSRLSGAESQQMTMRI
jgi:hypothetical protein